MQLLSINWLSCKFRVRPVFVEHYNGLPFGRILAEACALRARAIALIIQSLGEVNDEQCLCCASRQGQYTTAVPDRRHGKPERRSPVAYPFLGCVSQPSIDNGKCGNCAWHGTECRRSATHDRGGAFPSGLNEQGDLLYYNVTDKDWIRPSKAAAIAAQEQSYDGHRQGRM